MARSTLAAALLLAGLAVGATACDTAPPAVPPPAPISVPPAPGAPAEQDDDGEGAQPPGGQGDADDGPDEGPDDDG
jgi:hypothetical protein